MLITKLNYNSTQLAPLEDSPTRERSLVPAEPKPASDLELQELVRLAQSYNQEAIDELYKRFKGLIINEIKTSYVKAALGEDAENIAWEIFYQTVMELESNHPKGIVGKLKLRLHDRIINVIKRTKTPWQQDSLEQGDENGQIIADSRNEYKESISKFFLEKELEKLSHKGQFVMRKIYFEKYTISECAKILSQDYATVQKFHKRCLHKLQKSLNKQQYLQ